MGGAAVLGACCNGGLCSAAARYHVATARSDGHQWIVYEKKRIERGFGSTNWKLIDRIRKTSNPENQPQETQVQIHLCPSHPNEMMSPMNVQSTSDPRPLHFIGCFGHNL
jgi:hypothetical protein